MNKELKRRRWIVNKRLQGWKVSVIASHLRVSERTVIRWWKTFQLGGWEALEIKSKRPKTVHRIDKKIERRIVSFRKKTGMNEKAIKAKLEQEGIFVGHNTVYRVLKRHGLVNGLKKPRKKRVYRSWARKHPNSLWQTDLSIFENRWLATFLDDCSRFVVGIVLLDHATTDNVLWLFQRAINQYGAPRQVLTDHGTQYYASKGQVSGFTQFCKSQGIEHIFGGIGKPTTLGKIERFHRTFKENYQKFNNLNKFTTWYNHQKPHAAHQYQTPATIYLK